MQPPDIAFISLLYLGLLFSLCVHEAAHAAMGTWCGDDTARLQGRLTLNPMAHIDLIGTVILPLLLMFSSGFILGWAKPVPFNPRNLRNPNLDPIKIALAGPASNLLLALLFIFIARIMFMAMGGLEQVPQVVYAVFEFTILLNIILMVFNLIPVPPLDGHYVLNYFLPPNVQRMMYQLGPFGVLIAIIIAMPLFERVVPRARVLIGYALGI